MNIAVPQTIVDVRCRRIAQSLHSAAIHLLRMLRTEDRAAGIGPARLSALSVLVFGGPCSLKRLSALEQVRPPTMSRIVAGLEADGLVHREIAAADARKIVLSATPKGRQLLLRARARRVNALAVKMMHLSPLEQRLLERGADVLQNLARRR